ncbi:hypothetical protein ACRAWF_18540 [Streptomyces sp. L7]
MILAHLAAHTDRIRASARAASCSRNHAPLVIAEQFGTLEAGLAPNRVDLGLGRAPGTDGATAAAPTPDRAVSTRAPTTSPSNSPSLTRFLDDDFPSGHPLRPVSTRSPARSSRPRPAASKSPHRPPIWPSSAPPASAPGWPACSASRSPSPTTSPRQNTVPALDLYRESFRPSAVLDAPYALIGGLRPRHRRREARPAARCWPPPSTWSGCRTGRPGLVPHSRKRPRRTEFSPMERGVHHLLERQRHPRHRRRGPGRPRRPCRSARAPTS